MQPAEASSDDHQQSRPSLRLEGRRRSEGEMEFEEYVAARGRALERYAFVLTGNAQRSQDLVQTGAATSLCAVLRHSASRRARI
jgi:DNA-directed RNA polymerase specialized sigma24 family protein